ncbi:MAG: dihydrofolate reductase family protein [Opitutaceae bacterium]|nr:dihydrofolate reductase family protein [Opitutaceae bacterium]
MRIVLIAAQSLDGFITKHAQPGTAFTSPEDKAYFRAALATFDVCIFGAETYRVSRDFIRTQLPGRHVRLVMTRDPARYAAEAIPGTLEFTDAAPAALVDQLRGHGCQRCGLLGGSHIHSLFLEAGLADEVWLTIEPVLFGGGTPLLARPTDIRLELQASEQLGAHTLLLKYRVLR